MGGVFLIKKTSNTNEFKSCIVCGKLFKKWTMSNRPFATFCPRCSVILMSTGLPKEWVKVTYLHQRAWSSFYCSQCSPAASLCCLFWTVWTTRLKSCWQLSARRSSRPRRLPTTHLCCPSHKFQWTCTRVSQRCISSRIHLLLEEANGKVFARWVVEVAFGLDGRNNDCLCELGYVELDQGLHLFFVEVL